MFFLISFIIAYIVCGSANIYIDLHKEYHNRPFWTYNATISIIFIKVLTWIIPPFSMGSIKSIGMAINQLLTGWCSISLIMGCVHLIIPNLIICAIITPFITFIPVISHIFMAISVFIMIPVTFVITIVFDDPK
jgi:hypothetical protein